MNPIPLERARARAFFAGLFPALKIDGSRAGARMRKAFGFVQHPAEYEGVK